MRTEDLYQVKQDASRFTNPQDELIEAMISLARRTEADMASAPGPPFPRWSLTTLPASRKPTSPSRNRRKRRNPPSCHDESLDDLRPHHLAGIILHISVLAAVVVLCWSGKQESGASAAVRAGQAPGRPHGASQSRPVNYCMQDSRGPNSSDAGKCASTCATSHDRILPIPRNPRLSE
ncbi:MAG: hypothetical protein ACLT38_03100 [Akkermansia sp.]